MKRTASRVIRPRFFERNAFVNHVINIYAINEFLDKAFWNHILRLIVPKSLRAAACKLHRTKHHNALPNKTKKELSAPFFIFQLTFNTMKLCAEPCFNQARYFSHIGTPNDQRFNPRHHLTHILDTCCASFSNYLLQNGTHFIIGQRLWQVLL